jgi:hypothetical protein
MCHPSLDLSVLLDDLDTEYEFSSLEEAEMIAHRKLEKIPERRHLLAMFHRIEELELELETSQTNA